jgi:hypothetical protein
MAIRDRFKLTIRFGSSIYKNFSFLASINRPVSGKSKTDLFGFGFLGSVFQLNEKIDIM